MTFNLKCSGWNTVLIFVKYRISCRCIAHVSVYLYQKYILHNFHICRLISNLKSMNEVISGFWDLLQNCSLPHDTLSRDSEIIWTCPKYSFSPVFIVIWYNEQYYCVLVGNKQIWENQLNNQQFQSQQKQSSKFIWLLKISKTKCWL